MIVVSTISFLRKQQGFQELNCFETAPFPVAKTVLFLPFLPEYLS
jgi:hypothetical protein